MYKGIDVSVHNGTIDWKAVARQVDFAIIRAGYGKNNIDAKAVKNIQGCEENNIPYGLYWFSYALTEDMARSEADYVCSFADKYSPTYPICYDWEYDSDNHASKNGITFNNNDRERFARAFLTRVEERGYYAMIYSNPDYLNKGFSKLVDRFDLWLALWQDSKPSRNFGIWQSSSKGTIAGITGNVDLNYTEKEYKWEKDEIKLTEKEKTNFIKAIINVYKSYFKD